MTTTYENPVTTNVEAWRSVHDGLRDGLAFGEIAARIGVSYRMVQNYARMPQPARTNRRLNRHMVTPDLCACGRAKSYPGTGRVFRECGRCALRRQSAEANHDGRITALRGLASDLGRVPSIREATALLGISRSVAGDEVLRAFGPDHRDGAHRRQSYRGWPLGSPDVPR